MVVGQIRPDGIAVGVLLNKCARAQCWEMTLGTAQIFQQAGQLATAVTNAALIMGQAGL